MVEPADLLVEVDPNNDSSDRSDDNDSLYSSGAESATTSISSSVFNYQYENGRRYHAYRAGKYIIPNDETEQDRLDMMHHIYSLLLGGKLFESPVENPQNALDIGTGTGIWAIDFADMYPSAHVIGTDLSPIQPRWVPPNVQFLVDDCESDWTFTKGSFDLIHVRGMVGSVVNWPSFLTQCYDHLKPGGWLELFEMPSFRMACQDGTYNGSALERYYSSVEEASLISGRSLTIDETERPFESMFEDAGFLVKRPITKTTLPLGSWPKDPKQKELGRWAAATLESGFEAYGMALLTRVLGMDVEDVNKLIADCKAEVKSRKIHAYCVIINYCAQKPE